LINDGSIDNTATILEDYKKNHNNTMIIHQKNTGQGIARNVGIKEASGKYILFLDADDLYEINFFSKLIEVAEKNKSDITICKSNNFINEKDLRTSTCYAVNDKMYPTSSVFSAMDIKENIFNFSMGWAWDKLYLLDFIKKHNLKFPNLSNSEDLVFVYGAYCFNPTISIVNDVLIHHRIRKNSVSSAREKEPLAFIDATLKLKTIMIETGTLEEYKESFNKWVHIFFRWHYETVKNKKIVKKSIIKYYKNENLSSNELSYLKIHLLGFWTFSYSCEKFKIFGLTIFKRKKKNNKTRLYVCGIPLFTF